MTSPENPTASKRTPEEDDDHLRILSIFHYVMVGFAVAGVAFLAIHFFLMNRVFAMEGMFGNLPEDPETAEMQSDMKSMFGAFRLFYLFMLLIFLADGVINFLSARYLRQKKNRTFSIVVAGINCLWMPIGTVLGAFTIAVLLRPSVAQAYRS